MYLLVEKCPENGHGDVEQQYPEDAFDIIDEFLIELVRRIIQPVTFFLIRALQLSLHGILIQIQIISYFYRTI